MMIVTFARGFDSLTDPLTLTFLKRLKNKIQTKYFGFDLFKVF